MLGGVVSLTASPDTGSPVSRQQSTPSPLAWQPCQLVLSFFWSPCPVTRSQQGPGQSVGNKTGNGRKAPPRPSQAHHASPLSCWPGLIQQPPAWSIWPQREVPISQTYRLPQSAAQTTRDQGPGTRQWTVTGNSSLNTHKPQHGQLQPLCSVLSLGWSGRRQLGRLCHLLLGLGVGSSRFSWGNAQATEVTLTLRLNGERWHHIVGNELWLGVSDHYSPLVVGDIPTGREEKDMTERKPHLLSPPYNFYIVYMLYNVYKIKRVIYMGIHTPHRAVRSRFEEHILDQWSSSEAILTPPPPTSFH